MYYIIIHGFKQRIVLLLLNSLVVFICRNDYSFIKNIFIRIESKYLDIYAKIYKNHILLNEITYDMLRKCTSLSIFEIKTCPKDLFLPHKVMQNILQVLYIPGSLGLEKL